MFLSLKSGFSGVKYCISWGHDKGGKYTHFIDSIYIIASDVTSKMINYAKEKLPTRCDTQQLIFLMF